LHNPIFKENYLGLTGQEDFNLKKLNEVEGNVKIRIYKTIILPVVLYGYETWSLTLRGEHRLRVFGNRMLRKIF
jgi:hypothetical protein